MRKVGKLGREEDKMEKMILVLIAIPLLVLGCSGTWPGTETEKAISIDAAFEPVDQNLKGTTVQFKGKVAYFLRLGKVEKIADITEVTKKDKETGGTMDAIKFKKLSGQRQVFYAEINDNDLSVDRKIYQDGIIRAFRLDFSPFSGVYRRRDHYLSDTESRKLYEGLEHWVCESLVGRKFTTSEGKVFTDFSDSADYFSPKFTVGNPEEFTITSFVDKSQIHGEHAGWYGWYEVRFASGRKGFVQVMYLHYASNGPDVLNMIKARWH